MRDYVSRRIPARREMRRPADCRDGLARLSSRRCHENRRKPLFAMKGADQMSNVTRSTAALRALTVLAAIVATLVIWAVEARLLGIDLRARPVPGAAAVVVGPAAVVSFTLLAGLAAWGLLALLERLTSRARAVWIVVAVLALLISLAGPLGGAVTATAAVGLACMHVAAAAILIPLLPRSGGRRGSP
jgi:hypothetical protein